MRLIAGLIAPALLLGASCFTAIAATPTPEQEKFFESKVRPLLVDNCFSCHGEKKQKGGLRLDTLAGLQKGGKNGPVVEPGNPAESKLVTAVAYKDEDLQMPPDEKLSDEQVAVLTQWVQMGAPWPANSAKLKAPLAKSKKRTITADDRAFWSFQPPKAETPPAVTDPAHWCRTPIDHFILSKLQAEGLTPAPEADRRTLIRRLTFDLHGLPPTPAEVDAFINDASPDAYEKLVDRLLASPRYGEHWARHWLDLVRYAESDGYKQDAYRANAWPYRDYVIDAFNTDKSYDRFITEQLAGDEIAPNDPKITVATGYFRHGVYEYNQRDVPRQLASIVDDITDVTGDVMLGLSMGCAHCHDHKFDPILQADYYRLRAFFTPTLQRNDLPLATQEEWARYKKADEAWHNKAAPVLEAIDAIESPLIKKMMQTAIDKFPDETQAIMRKPVAERTPYEEQIAQLAYRQVNDTESQKLKIPAAEKEKHDALKAKLAEIEGSRPKPPLMLNGITDVSASAPPTYIPGHENEAIAPGYLVVLDGQPLKIPEIKPTDTSTGRRTALAKWLTQPNHPLVTRVIANRIWQYHFGKGLVATSSDYGRLGTPPTHPELLDYLATRFVKDGWSFKSMHRLILLSSTYRQAAIREVPATAKLKDPENKWLWRQCTRRLDAEQVRDAMLAVSGELKSDEHGGPSAEPTSSRRSVYTKVLRNTRDPLLELFDSPETFSSVPVRNCTTTANQALLMINGNWPLTRAAAFAASLQKSSPGADPATLVNAAYHTAYGRAPTPDESQSAVAFLLRNNAAAPQVAQSVEAPVTQTMPQRGGQAVLVRNANPADMFALPESTQLFKDDFTVEAYVQLESLYPDASVRVIASQWDGDQKHAGWAFGVTCEKSHYQPRNLILQVATPQGYEVVPSGMRIELHKSYYVAVSYKHDDKTDAAVTFYVKDLTDMDAPLHVTSVGHKIAGSCASKLPLVIGGRPNAKSASHPQGWDGLIDEVRVSTAALKSDQILYNDGDADEFVCGHWLLKEPAFFKDATGHHPDLRRLADKSIADTVSVPAGSPSLDKALIDFCHVLLNSNEFLYVD